MPSDISSSLEQLSAELVRCRRCPRLVEWRERVARERRASFADDVYWGRPVPAFGDPLARILIYGLAPAAHGGNRTGRVFTGDRSGDFLFASLWRCGLANQPTSTDRSDGLELNDVYVTAAVHCAPPANRPTPEEREECSKWSVGEMALLERVHVVVCLGAFAWEAALRLVVEIGGGDVVMPRPRPRFGHGAEVAVGSYTLLGAFHPSQQNTFTGKLTEEMLDAVFEHARALAGA